MPATMQYMALYVEVFTSADDEEVRASLISMAAGSDLLAPNGRVIGTVEHVQVTEGPTSVKQSRDAS